MEQSNKKGIWAVIVVLILIFVWYSLSQSSSSDTIKIGYFGPLTGPVAGDTGAAVLGGIKLALAKYPTLAGKKVEIIYEDDACTPPKAAAAANKLIDIDKVQVLINGVCSGSMLAVAPIAEAHKVILFTPISNSPKVSDAGDYIFRTSASAVRIGQTVSRGVSALGYKKVAVLYENAAFPVDWQTTFSDTYTGAGNTITTKESFESKTTDLRTQLLKIARTKPQAVVIVANSSVIQTSRSNRCVN
jgi:branched-chain amino acid transport system substrate-binding protein